MNILRFIFGIFRQGGLVTTIRENRLMLGFIVSSVLVAVLGGALYGFARGVGIDFAERSARGRSRI